MSFLARQLEINLLAYAVGRQMFCPVSGRALDVRTATLLDFSMDGEHAVQCVHSEYADQVIAETRAEAERLNLGHLLVVEVTDGPTLHHPVLDGMEELV